MARRLASADLPAILWTRETAQPVVNNIRDDRRSRYFVSHTRPKFRKAIFSGYRRRGQCNSNNEHRNLPTSFCRPLSDSSKWEQHPHVWYASNTNDIGCPTLYVEVLHRKRVTTYPGIRFPSPLRTFGRHQQPHVDRYNDVFINSSFGIYKFRTAPCKYKLRNRPIFAFTKIVFRSNHSIFLRKDAQTPT